MALTYNCIVCELPLCHSVSLLLSPMRACKANQSAIDSKVHLPEWFSSHREFTAGQLFICEMQIWLVARHYLLFTGARIVDNPGNFLGKTYIWGEGVTRYACHDSDAVYYLFYCLHFEIASERDISQWCRCRYEIESICFLGGRVECLNLKY